MDQVMTSDILTGLVGAPGIGNIGGSPGICCMVGGRGLLSNVPALPIIILISLTKSSDRMFL